MGSKGKWLLGGISVLLTVVVFQLWNLELFAEKAREFMRGKHSALMDRVEQHEVTLVDTTRLHSHKIIEFAAFDRTFTIDLEDSNAFLGDTLLITHRKDGVAKTKELAKDDIESCYYTGTVRGEDEAHSHATLSICEGQGIRGSIFVDSLNDTFVIAPAALYLDKTKDIGSKPHKETDAHIVFRNSDVTIFEGEHLCRADDLHAKDAVVTGTKKGAKGTKRRLAGAQYPISVSAYVVLDPSRVNWFKTQYGAKWEAHARATTMNVIQHVSHEYARQNWGSASRTSGVTVVLSHIEYWDDWKEVSKKGDNVQPGTAASGMDWDDLLGEFGEWFLKKVDQSKYDNAIMMSMLDFNGLWSYVGLAGLGAMHHGKWQASANIDTGKSFGKPYPDLTFAMIIAHELGHNFGMQHDQTKQKTNRLDPEGHACTKGSVMWPIIGGRGFSKCSVGFMQDGLAVMEKQTAATANGKFVADRFAHLKSPATTPFSSKCGNGITEAPEQCDDGAGATRNKCCNSGTCTLIADHCCDGAIGLEPAYYIASGFNDYPTEKWRSIKYKNINGRYDWHACENGKSAWVNQATGAKIFYYAAWQRWLFQDVNGQQMARSGGGVASLDAFGRSEILYTYHGQTTYMQGNANAKLMRGGAPAPAPPVPRPTPKPTPKPTPRPRPTPKPRTPAPAPRKPSTKRCAKDTRVEPESYTATGFKSPYSNAKLAGVLNGEFEHEGCAKGGSTYRNAETGTMLGFTGSVWQFYDGHGPLASGAAGTHITQMTGGRMKTLYAIGGRFGWGMGPRKLKVVRTSLAQDEIPDVPAQCVNCPCGLYSRTVGLGDSARFPKLNGVYRYAGCWKSRAVYVERQPDRSVLYLHYSKQGWEITNNLAKDDKHAFCPKADVAKCGNGDWYVENAVGTGDNDDVTLTKEQNFRTKFVKSAY